MWKTGILAPFSYFLFLLHKKFTGMLIIISMLNGKDFVLVLACHSARHYRMKYRKVLFPWHSSNCVKILK